MRMIDNEGLAELKRGFDECFEISGIAGVAILDTTRGSVGNIVWGAAAGIVWWNVTNNNI